MDIKEQFMQTLIFEQELDKVINQGSSQLPILVIYEILLKKTSQIECLILQEKEEKNNQENEVIE